MGSVYPAAGLEWTPIWVDQEQEDGKRQVKEVVRRKIRSGAVARLSHRLTLDMKCTG